MQGACTGWKEGACAARDARRKISEPSHSPRQTFLLRKIRRRDGSRAQTRRRFAKTPAAVRVSPWPRNRAWLGNAVCDRNFVNFHRRCRRTPLEITTANDFPRVVHSKRTFRARESLNSRLHSHSSDAPAKLATPASIRSESLRNNHTSEPLSRSHNQSIPRFTFASTEFEPRAVPIR